MMFFSLALLALPVIVTAETITFMLPYYASVWSGAIQTVTDSTTVYALRCNAEGEFGPCNENEVLTYTIHDSQNFGWEVTDTFSTYSTTEGTVYTLTYHNSGSTSCSITSDGAYCTETATDMVSTIGQPEPASVISTQTGSGYTAMFPEFVIDVPATGTGSGHVTAITFPFIGATAVPSTTQNASGSASTETSNANGTASITGTASNTATSNPANTSNAANRNAAGALIGAAALVMAAL
jgi:hypothetical protein